MDLDDLIQALARGGLLEEEEAMRSLRATLVALSELLTEDEAAGFRVALPLELRPSLESPRAIELSNEDLYERVAQHLDVSPALARERAQLVCEAIGQRLSPDLVARLDKHLPADVALLLHPRERDTGEIPDHAVARASGHTLASGAAGSRHPISMAHPDLAQSHSVVREENPHAETKLSSTSGVTQERLEDSLATGKPGTERTISTTRDSRR